MGQIAFSDVGVVVNSMEELDELYLTYTALGIPFGDSFKEDCVDAQHDLKGWFIQSTRGGIRTKLDGSKLMISLIHYPIKYSMESLDFAVACHLIKTNQEDELIAHLAQHCEEYK